MLTSIPKVLTRVNLREGEVHPPKHWFSSDFGRPVSLVNLAPPRRPYARARPRTRVRGGGKRFTRFTRTAQPQRKQALNCGEPPGEPWPPRFTRSSRLAHDQ